jgi:hypothetical protein
MCTPGCHRVTYPLNVADERWVNICPSLNWWLILIKVEQLKQYKRLTWRLLLFRKRFNVESRRHIFLVCMPISILTGQVIPRRWAYLSVDDVKVCMCSLLYIESRALSIITHAYFVFRVWCYSHNTRGHRVAAILVIELRCDDKKSQLLIYHSCLHFSHSFASSDFDSSHIWIHLYRPVVRCVWYERLIVLSRRLGSDC